MPNQEKPGRPKLNRRTKRISLIVPIGLHKRIEKRAKGDRRSLNAMAIELFEKALRE